MSACKSERTESSHIEIAGSKVANKGTKPSSFLSNYSSDISSLVDGEVEFDVTPSSPPRSAFKLFFQDKVM